MLAREAFSRFSPLIRRDYPALAGGALLFIAATAAEIFAIFQLSDVIDQALTTSSTRAFITTAFLWLAITIFGAAMEYYGQLVCAAVAERFVLRLRDTVYAHLLKVHPRELRRLGIGDLVSRHTSDLEMVEHLTGSGLVQLVIALLSAIGLATAATIMSWQLALCAVVAVPILLGLSSRFSAAQERATYRERAGNAALSGSIAETLAIHETVVANNQERREAAHLNKLGRSYLSARMSQTKVEAGFGAIMSVGEVLSTLAIAVVGVWQVRTGVLTVGELLALTGYLGYLYPKIQELIDLRLSLTSAAVSAERLAELLDLPPAAPLTATANLALLTSEEATIEFADVNYHYSDGGAETSITGTSILENASLRLSPNTITALTGPSGIGKSTLASLLTRFSTPVSGSISLGGQEISQFTSESVRNNITLLPQRSAIKAGTVAENISYGKPEATLPEIISAARAADAHEFISALPNGYQNVLDEDGQELSGGQRQRIAIARALLRDTPVLILDEPTTGLDDATVERILGPLKTLATGRTTLLITHDQRAVNLADTHYQLIAKKIIAR